MKTKGRKTNTNLSLKLAIVGSRKTSRRVALRAGIGEVRLSAIIHGRLDASDDEKKALARVLKTPIETLFPSEDAAATSGDYQQDSASR